MKLLIGICNFKKSAAMRKSNLFSAVLTLFLLVPASITWAQTISSQKGLTTANFFTQNGNIKIYLPDDIRPGDVISGRIVAIPSGKNAKQIERNFVELLKFTVNLNGEKFPVNKEAAAFKFISHLDRNTTNLVELIHISGVKAHELSLPAMTNENRMPVSSKCVSPGYAMAGSPIRVGGSFDGDASNTKCMLDNIPMEILAESPRQCIFSFPDNTKGTQTIRISENNKETCTQQLSIAGLELSVGKQNLRKGESTVVQVTVTGLDNLNDTAKLTIINKSPDVVIMKPAPFVFIPLVKDSLKSGNYEKKFDVQSIRTGNFIISADLDLPGVQYDIKNVQFNFRQNPGSYGWRGGDPCENAGPITWRWHRTLPCAVELKVTPYGTTPDEKEAIDYIIEKLKELSKKGGNLGSKMGKCLSFQGRAFSMFARCYRDWDDWDVTYVCVDGKWVQTSMVHVASGRDNLSGWIALRNAGGNNEWLSADDFNWVIEAIEKAVTCCN